MSRVKQAGKHARTDPNAPQPPLRLSQTPVERWFAEDDEKTAYDEHLSRMEILPPKYIGDGVLPNVKYPEFWQLIDIQGLRPFLYMLGRYYPRFVAAAFTTISIREDSDEDEGDGFALGFRLGGVKFKFTLAALATSWGLKNQGDTFKGGSYPLGSWDEFSKATTMRELRLDYAMSGKYTVSRMSTDHHLLLYVLSYVLLPQKSNHGTATKEDLLILWAIAGSFLRLAHLWTGLFEMAPLDLSRGEMGNAAEGVGEEAAGDMPMPDTQPQPTVGTSSQVPTETEVPSQELSEVIELVRKGFEEMRMMMSEGFTRLSEHIDGLDTHMTSQDVDIRSLRDEFHSFKGKDVAFDPPKHQDGAPAQD
ncbi:hypothetical protein PIB30_090894 [Stylosanthes scabra]|uniref:Uncharacterized protein n=1 Tax=Stylosanthes scabra TaxID=79078 RepID=A0ABU6WUH0_9FABA|nr:hypothetical protein [Stylosanthes scabra]